MYACKLFDLALSMHGSRKFNSDNFFFELLRGEKIQIPQKVGLHRPASETPFHLRANDGPTLKAGLAAL